MSSPMSNKDGPSSPIRKNTIFEQKSPLKQKSISKKDLLAPKSKEEILEQTRANLYQIKQTIQRIDLETENSYEREFLMDLLEEESSILDSDSERDEMIKHTLPSLIQPTLTNNGSGSPLMRRQSTLVDVAVN